MSENLFLPRKYQQKVIYTNSIAQNFMIRILFVKFSVNNKLLCIEIRASKNSSHLDLLLREGTIQHGNNEAIEEPGK